jgi:hypothetical protein
MVMPRSLSINHDILIRNNVKLLFNKLDTGYTSHTIIDNTLTTNFWSITGNIIHSFQVKK